MTDKLKELSGIYALLAYEKLGELSDVQYLETTEHYRTPPHDISGWKPAAAGTKWGTTLGTAWFSASLLIKPEWDGRELFLRSRTGAAEDMVFTGGVPRGILSQTDKPLGSHHYALPFAVPAKGGERLDIALEGYAGAPYIGCAPFDHYGQDPKSIYNHVHTYIGIDVMGLRADVLDFALGLNMLLMLGESSRDEFVKAGAMSALEEVNRIICEYPCEARENEWRPPLGAAAAVIKAELSSKKASPAGEVALVGHSHMDTAWLWPVRETVRKCARTYSNVLSMMELFPEYTFTQSSSLHTDWMRRYYPDIFEGIKRRVAEGRYECNGGVWVECDCNITGGESMVRQFLYGQKFTSEYFGKKSDCFWLPDTFGYNGNIPQIMKGCGVDYFMTTKISWNDTNPFPYDAFYWRGIDSTEVMTNFNVIGGPANPQTINDRISSIKDKRVTDRTLISYGQGDGGGGPTYEMIKTAKELKKVAGLPKTRHMTVSEHLKSLEKTIVDPPVYDGELYLEIHRGTLTSQHDIKRNNRKAEVALHDLELFNCAAMARSGSKRDDRLEELYKELLKNQFHDILPGSSIMEVHKKAKEDVAALIGEINAASDGYLSGFCDKNNDALTVYNTLSWTRAGQFTIDAAEGFDAFEGAAVQHYTDILGRKKTVVSEVKLPPLSAVCLKKGAGVEKKNRFTYNGNSLKTPFAKIKFDKDGYIKSFVDTTCGRELRRESGYPLGALLCAEDVPRAWDNWDIDGDIEGKFVLQNGFKGRELISGGPLQLRLRSEWKVGKASRVVQDMVFYADTPRVDFETVMYWEDRHVFMKAAFETALRVTEAQNEIQYGYIARPTTRNNTIEAAKFEICNHKWTDISENRYGVALLNDCKYGLSAKGGSLFLSLHKSGIKPDYTGDSGVHEATYSFLPHASGFSVPAVTMPAYELNYPVKTASGAPSAGAKPLFTVDSDHVIIEVVKPSEDGAAIVARLYEAERSAASVAVTPGFAFSRAELTNMLEEKIADLSVKNGKVRLPFRAFEIKTVKFYL